MLDSNYGNMLNEHLPKPAKLPKQKKYSGWMKMKKGATKWK